MLALFGFVPEEEQALGQLLALRLGAEHGLQGVGVEARVPRLGADGHGGGSEVLHLLQVEVEPLGDDSQFGHVLLVAVGMAGDEVGDELLVQAFFAVDAVEHLLECFKLLERRFAHDGQHVVRRVLGSHLEPSADVAGNEFAGILAGMAVDGFVAVVVQQQVVAHAAAYERLLDAGQGIDRSVEVEQGLVVGVQVGADGRVDARGAAALLAEVEVASVHAVHVGAGASQVAQVAFEVGHLGDGLHLLQDAFAAAAHDELALVCRYGAEGTAAEAPAVDVDGKLYHVVGRNALPLVLGVRHAGVGQVEGVVELGLREGRVGRIHHHGLLAYLLQDACGSIAVAFLLDVAEVGRLLLFILQAFFVRVQAHVAFLLLYALCQVGRLGQGADGLAEILALQQSPGQFGRVPAFHPYHIL